MLALFALAMTLLWIPWVPEIATTPRWALLGVGVSLFLLSRPVRPSSAHWLLLALLAWSTLTLAWSPAFWAGIERWAQLALLASTFALASTLSAPEKREVRAAFLLGISINAAIAAAQLLGWQGIPQAVAPAGTFANKNFLGEAAAIALVWALSSRSWWAVPGAALALALPYSRVAWLAAFVCLPVAVWRSPLRHARYWATLIAVAGFCVAMYVRSWGAGDRSIDTRWSLWQDTLAAVTHAGSGIGSFGALYPLLQLTAPEGLWAFGRIPGNPHSDVVLLIFELGTPAALLAGALLLLLWSAADDELRYPLLALAVVACISFPLLNPTTGFVAAVLAGLACRRRAHARDAVALGGDRLAPGGRIKLAVDDHGRRNPGRGDLSSVAAPARGGELRAGADQPGRSDAGAGVPQASAGRLAP